MIRLFNRINSNDPAKRFLLRASNLAGNEINFSNREELFTQQIHFNCTPSRSIPIRITESEGVLNGRYRALIDCLSASSFGTTINDGALMNCRNRIWGGCANWSCRWWQAQRWWGVTHGTEKICGYIGRIRVIIHLLRVFYSIFMATQRNCGDFAKRINHFPLNLLTD